MKLKRMIMRLDYVANCLEIVAIVCVLSMAMVLQFGLDELPCPLCLLQRFGFMAIAFGFLLNLRFGFRPSHYALVILSALFTAFVALRQVALHILPGTGAYGSAFLGWHLYTWSFILAMLIVMGTTVLLSIDGQYLASNRYQKRMRPWVNVLLAVMAFIITANIFSVIVECGFKECPDNPSSYSLLAR